MTIVLCQWNWLSAHLNLLHLAHLIHASCICLCASVICICFFHLLANLFSPKYGACTDQSWVGHVCAYHMSASSFSGLHLICPGLVLTSPSLQYWWPFMIIFWMHHLWCYNPANYLTYCPGIGPLVLSGWGCILPAVTWDIFTCVLAAYGLNILSCPTVHKSDNISFECTVPSLIFSKRYFSIIKGVLHMCLIFHMINLPIFVTLMKDCPFSSVFAS